MYTMKEASQATGLTYETLKFYCNQGLLPNVKRDRNNHRVFDDHDVAWLKSLACLKGCGMSLAEMKAYLKHRYHPAAKEDAGRKAKRTAQKNGLPAGSHGVH